MIESPEQGCQALLLVEPTTCPPHSCNCGSDCVTRPIRGGEGCVTESREVAHFPAAHFPATPYDPGRLTEITDSWSTALRRTKRVGCNCECFPRAILERAIGRYPRVVYGCKDA